MPDLVFATRGQAEALAAQESLHRSARKTKEEFEQGAKAAGVWDSSMAQLKRQGESALRSIQTEQDKIVQKIANIEEAQKAGLIPPEEAEKGIRELRKRWVEVDESTKEANERQREFADGQAQLKSKAEAAMGGVRTEIERVKEQIESVREAAKQGLVPTEDAEEAVRRLKKRVEELGEQSESVGERINMHLGKAFSIDRVLKMGVSLVGVAAVKRELSNLAKEAQAAVDTAAKFSQTEEEAAFGLAREFATHDQYGPARSRRAFQQANDIAGRSRNSRANVYAMLSTLLGEGIDLDTALNAIDRYANLYPDKPGEALRQARDFIMGNIPPNERLPSRKEIESIIPGGAPKLDRRGRLESAEDKVQRRRAEMDEAAGLATAEELERANRARESLGVDRYQAYLSTIGARMPWSEGGTGITRAELANMVETYMEIAQRGGGLRMSNETDQELLAAIKELANEFRGIRSDMQDNRGGMAP